MNFLGQSEDRRGTARINVLKSGTVVSVDGLHREACVIDNLSETGALLIVEQPQQLPQTVLLVIDGEKNRRPARVIRRDKNTVAVCFVTRETENAEESGWVFPLDET